MATRIDKLTPEQEAAMPGWAQKWIDIGLQTGDADFETFEKAIKVAYAKADIPFPNKIIRVQSPIVGALAASISRTLLQKFAPAERSEVKFDAVESAVCKVVGRAVERGIDNAVGWAVERAVRSVIVEGAVGSDVGSAVERAVGSAVERAVGSDVGSAVERAVGSAVERAVGSDVGSAVERAVGSAVGRAVGSAVGSAVESAVRRVVGRAVGSVVHNSAVGSAVGSAVRRVVGSVVERGVESVELTWHDWFGGQFWAGWGFYGWRSSPSFVSFFTDIAGLELSPEIMERAKVHRDLCASVNYFWSNAHFVMVCDRPQVIARDDKGRLHNDQRKAIEYKDGWGLYALDGVVLKENVWQQIVSQTMSFEQIVAIPDADVRAVALKYNKNAIIDAGAELIDEHPQFGELFLIKDQQVNKLLDERELYFMRMQCPTGRTFVECCPPEVAQKHPSILYLQASAFGVSPDIYSNLQPRNEG